MRTRIALAAALAAMSMIIAMSLEASGATRAHHTAPDVNRPGLSHLKSKLAALRQLTSDPAQPAGTSPRAQQSGTGNAVLFGNEINHAAAPPSEKATTAPFVAALAADQARKQSVAIYLATLDALHVAQMSPQVLAASAAPPPPPAPAPDPAQTTASGDSGGGDVGSWERVAMCEEGGQDDPTYGYYGITPGSWAAYGGTQYASTAGGASQEEQVAIANRISGGSIPDGNGCAGW